MEHRGGFLSRLVLTIFALAICAVAACMSSPALAEKRVALVVGNGAYQNAPRLPNPKNDAEDVAAALKRSGFETIVGLDLDKAGMDDATIRFARAAREADIAIFYYSGHAMQFAGVNYLMPVDAKLTDEADLRRMARVDDIVADVQQAKNLRILVLDSCRDNPLAEELKRTIGRTRAAAVQRGLAKIDSPQGMIVAYSTQAGRTAEDGRGRNSPYTTAFLKHIEATAEIGTVFRRVSADVYEGTNRAQLPELSLSLIGEFYLRGQPAASSPIAAPQPTVTVPSPSNEVVNAWGEVKNTSNPAVLEAFIRRFGDSFYGDLARARLDELKRSQAVAVAPPVRPTPPAPPPQAAAPSSIVENEPVLLGAEGNRARPQLDELKKSQAAAVTPPTRPTTPAPPPQAANPSSGVATEPVRLGQFANDDRAQARLDELKKSQSAAVVPPTRPTTPALPPQAANPSSSVATEPVRLGQFANDDPARVRLDELKKSQSAAVAPPTRPTSPAPASQAALPTAIVGKGAVLLGQYGDWGAYSAAPNGKKVCFALARLVNSPPGTRNQPRDPTYLFISTRPADGVKNEFSIMSDYSFKPASDAVVEIGGTSYAMYTQNNQAWIKNRADETRLIDAMLRHPKVSIKGDTARGARPSDDYAIKGLGQALDRVGQECR
ncbi:MAG: hypothetical protein JWN71_19 [Xanthobacteraceae bacterium]|nr:hypothetical protein [Xanthobacteraceae bacterium]